MISIPARSGKALRLGARQSVKVINTHGQQVVDTWAFNAADLGEFMSMEHARVTMGHIIPKVGDRLVTNRRRAILQIVEDTSGGIHDTLIAACDRWRYEQLGCPTYHDNCTDNLAAAMRELGLVAPETPSPLNLFMKFRSATVTTSNFCRRSARPAATSHYRPRWIASSYSRRAHRT